MSKIEVGGGAGGGGGGSGTSSPLVDAVLTGNATLNGEPLGVLLKGSTVPKDLVEVGPVVGDWTWSTPAGSWVGPAYAVSWQTGDDVGVVPLVDGAGTGAVQPSRTVGTGPYESDQPDNVPQFDWGSTHGPDGLVTTAPSAGSGIVFLIQQEEGFGGPTTPPRPDLDVLDYLGDLVLTNGTTPIPWAADRGDGYDGDYWLHVSGPTKTLYGPKNDGVWDSSVELGGTGGAGGGVTGWVRLGDVPGQAISASSDVATGVEGLVYLAAGGVINPSLNLVDSAGSLVLAFAVLMVRNLDRSERLAIQTTDVEFFDGTQISWAGFTSPDSDDVGTGLSADASGITVTEAGMYHVVFRLKT